MIFVYTKGWSYLWTSSLPSQNEKIEINQYTIYRYDFISIFQLKNWILLLYFVY